MDRDDLIFMVGEVRADVKQLLSMSGSHEGRIRSLEGSHKFVRGALWAIGTVVTALVLPIAKAVLF
jgi:hypothetical protein